MKISIITVCFNAEKTIERTINSVVNQSYSDIEYIIVDGGSSDGTIEIINKYLPKISIFISEKDNGIYDAMNKGIKMATGDVIGILNADDIFNEADTILHIAELFENKNTDSIYADLQYVKGDRIIRHWKSGKYSISNWHRGWMPPHPTFYVKKWVYEKYGAFNLSLKLAADYELMLRFLLKNKITVAYLPEVSVKMEVGGESNKSIKNRIKANQEDKKAWTINELSMPFILPILKPLRKIFQFIIRE